MDKLLVVNIQGGRKVSGYLRGFDIFLNVVIDEAREEGTADKTNCGTVVSVQYPWPPLSLSPSPPFPLTDSSNPQVIRGNSITSMEVTATR